jgi:hypothetical protein
MVQAAYLDTEFPILPGQWRLLDPVSSKPCAPPARGKVAYLDMACPRGRGYCGSILVGNGFKPDPATHGARASWHWNGSTERPTLSPSINCLSHNPQKPAENYAGCGWHAWLKEGEFA